MLWNSTWPWLWISWQRGGIFWNYFVVVQSKQHMLTITRWSSSGVPIEKIRTIWKNFARYVSTPNGNQRKQLPYRVYKLLNVMSDCLLARTCFRLALIHIHTVLIFSIGTPHDLHLVIPNMGCFGWTKTKFLHAVKKFIASAMLSFKARSFQTARALLTGRRQAFLIYETINLTYIFLFLRRSCEGMGKIVFHTNIRNLISKQETWSTNMYFR